MDTNTDKPELSPATVDPLDFGYILRTLRRHSLIILISTVIFTGIAGWRTSKEPRLYSATTRVDVDLSTSKSGINLSGSLFEAGPDPTKMATQLGILSSQTIAWNVIKQLGLYKDPRFVGKAADPHQNPDAILPVFQAGMSSMLLAGLDVQFEKGTEIADISYTSTDPQLAAEVANGFAQAYIDYNYQNRFITMQNASKWLIGQLEDLRKQVEASEQAFADYQAKTGIVQTDESHGAVTDAYNRLSVALTLAEEDRILKEAKLRQSASADPDQVLSSVALPTLQALRTQKATLDAEYASLSPVYGDAYPRVAQLRNQIAEVQSAIDIQIERGRKQLQVDFEVAAANEQKLRTQVDAQRTLIYDMNGDALQYSLLQHEVTSKRTLYESLTAKLQEAQLTSGLNAESISILDRAVQPLVPFSPSVRRNLESGGLMGLILGIALAFVIENFNSSVRSVSDVEHFSNHPLLTVIPHFVRPKAPTNIGASIQVIVQPRSQVAEAYRNLRSSLLLSTAGSPPQVILVCSAWPQEGKSTTAINLATVLAQTGKRVLLVDADLKRPTLHDKLALTGARLGLSDLLTSAATPGEDTYLHIEHAPPSLSLLPSGKAPPSSSELLMSQRMKDLIGNWRQHFDFVVVDTAPLLAVSDTTALVPLADTSVLVVRSAKTRRQSLRALSNTIITRGGRIAGVVLNDVKSRSEAYYGYYGEKGTYGADYSASPNE